MSRASEIKCLWVGIVSEIEQIPTRSGWFVPRERAGVQECVVLRSPVTEFQVLAATWRFGFFNRIFHI